MMEKEDWTIAAMFTVVLTVTLIAIYFNPCDTNPGHRAGLFQCTV